METGVIPILFYLGVWIMALLVTSINCTVDAHVLCYASLYLLELLAHQNDGVLCCFFDFFTYFCRLIGIILLDLDNQCPNALLNAMFVDVKGRLVYNNPNKKVKILYSTNGL